MKWTIRRFPLKNLTNRLFYWFRIWSVVVHYMHNHCFYVYLIVYSPDFISNLSVIHHFSYSLRDWIKFIVPIDWFLVEVSSFWKFSGFLYVFFLYFEGFFPHVFHMYRYKLYHLEVSQPPGFYINRERGYIEYHWDQRAQHFQNPYFVLQNILRNFNVHQILSSS